MNDLGLIVNKIKRDKGLDLSGYRESTITRRIERRMQFDGASSLEEYIRMIDKDYHLYWRLISDFFIGVTDFFRDKEIWEIMEKKILPEIIKQKTKDKSHHFKPILRIWSAGCSTGEETYSFTTLLYEVLKDSISNFFIYVYGTDIMEDKLSVAKNGEYEQEKVEKVEEGLREKYFVMREENNTATQYAVRSDLRQLTRFRKYDLVRGEELRGFDIIVCRNVLIYFQRHLQEKVLVGFHKALNHDGILWLGTAEGLSQETAKLFEPVYKNEKIFRKM